MKDDFIGVSPLSYNRMLNYSCSLRARVPNTK